jgi:hypothetical protein
MPADYLNLGGVRGYSVHCFGAAKRHRVQRAQRIGLSHKDA